MSWVHADILPGEIVRLTAPDGATWIYYRVRRIERADDGTITRVFLHGSREWSRFDCGPEDGCLIAELSDEQWEKLLSEAAHAEDYRMQPRLRPPDAVFEVRDYSHRSR